MGLKDLIDDDVNKTEERFRYYGKDDREEVVWEWIEEFQEKFPEEVRCDFVEISPADVSYHAMAYWRNKEEGGHHQYIRVSETTFNIGEWRARQSVLHEMVHLYHYQKGFKDMSDSSRMFTWLCGKVGCVINQVRAESDEWETFAEPFLDESMKE